MKPSACRFHVADLTPVCTQGHPRIRPGEGRTSIMLSLRCDIASDYADAHRCIQNDDPAAAFWSTNPIMNAALRSL